ncbi:MAG: serine/threonine protein kinase, partial [Planctomycetes bacterium]|nr:serine/threonine protein kinase [Planctomycetota bacterium]
MVGDGDERATIKRLFAEASELPAEQRAAFLDRECPTALRAEVDDLLGYADPDGFLRPHEEAAPAAPLPARIGGYLIERELGRGGMGRVYLARQERPDRRVAVKVLHHPQVGELKARFEREAELLGRLEHPGIARVYEAGVDEAAGVPFLAMELVDGTTLAEHLRAAAPGLRPRLELVVAIADAVAHAHQKGVLHRDLKPGNVM